MEGMNENLTEQIPEPSPIKVSFEYTTSLNEAYGGQQQIAGTELPPLPEGLPEWKAVFDGYIESPRGQFAFQGKVETARRLLLSIERYCELSSEYEGLSGKLREKRQIHDYNTSRYAQEPGRIYPDETTTKSRYENSLQELREMESGFQKLESEFRIVKSEIEKYKL
jgi:hypothetical protein